MKTYKITCHHCQKTVERESKQQYKKGRKHTFCSQRCGYDFHNTSITKPCRHCGASVMRPLSEFRKSKTGNVFCNHSCACSFHNTQKRNSRRSKCEIQLFDLLVEQYPNLAILSTNKAMLDGYEVDISIPELNLGIEWNGIVHFKPIYGQTKLDNVLRRDQEKQEVAKQKGINLIIIPDLVSTKQRVKEAFTEICCIIDKLPPLDLNQQPKR